MLVGLLYVCIRWPVSDGCTHVAQLLLNGVLSVRLIPNPGKDGP